MRIYNLIIKLKSLRDVEIRQNDIETNMEKYMESTSRGCGNSSTTSDSISRPSDSISSTQSKCVPVEKKERNQFECMIKKLRFEINNKVSLHFAFIYVYSC